MSGKRARIRMDKINSKQGERMKDNTGKREIFVTVGSFTSDEDSTTCFSWKTLSDARKGFFDSEYQDGMISDDEMSDDEVNALFGECDRERGIYSVKMTILKMNGCPCCGK